MGVVRRPAGQLAVDLQQTLASIDRELRDLTTAVTTAQTTADGKQAKIDPDFTAPTAYATQTAGVSYNQATLQTLMNAAKNMHTVLSAIVTELNAGN